MGCHFLFQRIFPIQEANPGLPHCRQPHCRLYHLSHQGNPKQSRNSFSSQILPFPELIYFSRSALPSQSSYHSGWQLGTLHMLFSLPGILFTDFIFWEQLPLLQDQDECHFLYESIPDSPGD